MKTGSVLMLLGLFLLACNSPGATAHRAPASQPVRTTAVSPVSPRTAGIPDIDAVIRDADRAFASARYAKAVTLLRGALAAAPKNPALWSHYDRALLARAGNRYLRSIPPHRYRIDIPTFVKNREDHVVDYFILDVREPREFDAGHLAGAVNVPLRQVLQHLNVLPAPTSKTVLLVVCYTQHRANHVIVLLRELGYKNAYTLHGGYKAYSEWLKKEHVPKTGEIRLKKTRRFAPSSNSPAGASGKEEDFGC